MKLRRTVSEVVRPASTPPIIASAIKDDDDEDRIIAELEVSAGGAAGCPSLPALEAMPTLPCLLMRGCAQLRATAGNTLGSGPENDIPHVGTAVGFPLLACIPAGTRCHRDGQHRAVAPCRTPRWVQLLRAWFTVSLQHFHPVLGFKPKCFLTLRSFSWRFAGFCAQGTLQRSHLRCHPQALSSPRLAVPHVLPPFAMGKVPEWVVAGFSLAGFPPGGRGTGDAAGGGTGDVVGSRGTGVSPWLMRTADVSLAADDCQALVLA